MSEPSTLHASTGPPCAASYRAWWAAMTRAAECCWVPSAAVSHDACGCNASRSSAIRISSPIAADPLPSMRRWLVMAISPPTTRRPAASSASRARTIICTCPTCTGLKLPCVTSQTGLAPPPARCLPRPPMGVHGRRCVFHPNLVWCLSFLRASDAVAEKRAQGGNDGTSAPGRKRRRKSVRGIAILWSCQRV